MKKLSKDEMKKVMGGEDYWDELQQDDGQGVLVKCCPKNQPDSPQCSRCILAFGTASCSQGVVTDC